MSTVSEYKVTHITEYTYDNEASLCHNVMYKTPMESHFQQVDSFDCEITPNPNFLIKRRDFFGNESIYFSVNKLHKKLTVKAQSVIKLRNPDWLRIKHESSLPWEEVVLWLHSSAAPGDIKQFYVESDLVPIYPEIKEYALKSFTPERPVFDAVMELNTRIFKDFTFTPGFTDISTPVQTVFKTKKGVCQDFAHIGLSCLRSVGLSAKYMSGYLETVPPPGKPKLIGADASHAWIAVYIPQWGWVEFDSTNNVLVQQEHIRVASGRDFSDVTPLKGIVYSSGEQQLKVSVDVSKVKTPTTN
jgi:transglutaminase-like putative cysteine protease